ncbi:MAG: CHAT domain-containing protein [Bacteroidales bacterium]|nr:CHAT domain-containing protein [Bacteroidales bacterium]MCF8391996.1 CHAT domain-containing protein [Bacteroidales bacterium]
MRSIAIILICIFPLNAVAQNEQEQLSSYNAFYQYYIDGEYLKAMKSMEALLSISDDSLVISKRDVYHSNGILLGRMGLYEEALAWLARSEEFCDPPGISPYSLLLNYNSRANIYQNLGDFQKSALFFEKALDMMLSYNDHSIKYYDYLSMIYLNYGILNYKREDFESANALFLKSLELKRAYKFDYISNVYLNLAKVADRSKRFEEAESYYKMAETIIIQSFGDEYNMLADVYLEYAELLLEIQEYDKAEHYIRKGIGLSTKNVGELHPGTASAFQILGDMYTAQKEFGKALESYQKALIALNPGFTEMDPALNPPAKSSLDDIRYIELLRSKGKVFYEQVQTGDLSDGSLSAEEVLGEAIQSIQLAIEVKNKVQNSYASMESRLYLSENEKDLYVEGIRYALRLYELEKDELQKELAYNFVSQYKAAELKKTLHSREAIHQIEKVDPLYSELNMVDQSLRQYTDFIFREEQSPAPDSVKINAWKNELFSLSRSYDSLENLAKTKSWYARLKEDLPIFSSKEIRSRLNAGQSIIDYVISSAGADGRQELFIFVTGRKGLSIIRQSTAPEFGNILSYYLRALSSPPDFSSSLSSYDSLKTSSFQLYSVLIEPVEHLLKGKELIIVPDEELLLLPFESLINSNPKEEIINFSGLPYLLHEYYISYSLSASMAFSGEKIKFRKPHVVAFAPGIGEFSDSQNEMLEEARNEINVAATLFPGSYYYDSEASKEKFLECNSDNDILHFAMHSNRGGFIASEGSLEFYPGESDNKLWGYEISFLDIESPLVVLSGCNTGLGKINRAEGVFSLSRNFLEAGAQSVVQTLWSVDDGSSSSIIQQFYKNIAGGQGKNTSLHKSKEDYLSHASPFFTHPYYWSGIQLLGNTEGVMKAPWRRNIAIAFMVFLVLTYFVRRILRKREVASDL